jgi:serine O-acetyltransferase
MGKLVVAIYRVIYFLHRIRIPILPKLLNIIFIRLLFSCQISLGAQFGKGSVLGYGGLGTVIHHRAVIGDKVHIGQGVTIGGKSKVYGVPRIGNYVYIGAGARILGDITIGDNVIIGANSVVVKDVPSGCIVAGIPAKIIKHDIIISEYEDM